jgi:hypothetical protein
MKVGDLVRIKGLFGGTTWGEEGSKQVGVIVKTHIHGTLYRTTILTHTVLIDGRRARFSEKKLRLARVR